ncbi:MAG TPA: ubiquitin-like small modifier protein 1 [Gemmatimonadaceae bacterium]|nr:ubiquitin-like small modifier protein 1 [Gemmatimonadaceae bacterium]
MAISINLPAILAPLAGGTRVVELEGETVGNAVEALTARYPALTPRILDEAGDQYPFVAIYLNDDDIRFLSGFETAVQDGDELSIVPAVAGG